MTRFSDAFLDELRARLSIVDVIGSRLSWDMRRSRPGQGDYWACCPFHGEKTPSFHVLEKRGRFHCFGCHEKGSAIDFVMKMDRVTFPEAVERLAEQAGLPLPQRDPAAAAREARRADLTEVTEEAVAAFRAALAGPDGRAAREYLHQRGVRPETIDRFEIGLAVGGRSALTGRLRRGGASLANLRDVDLTAVPDDAPNAEAAAYDRFQNRLMFPIRDGRGRCVAFGGRDMTGRSVAKYMNSRETPLFSKKRTLYNLAGARDALARVRRPAGGEAAAPPAAAARLLVAEGYMDVIALWQGGFEAAVAPLGTAVTEEQLEQLWRLDPTPVLALDGDVAGRRAAEQTARRALAQLGPRKSLAFAMLPPGLDPDDLLRAAEPQGGPAAMAAVIDAAEALVDLLWSRECEAGPLDTPEGRADFDARLAAIAEQIQDPGLRRHYGWTFRNKTFEFFRGRRGSGRGRGGGKGRWPDAALTPLSTTRRAAAETADGAVRDGVLVLSLLNHPDVARSLIDDLWELELSTPRLDSFLAALLSAVGSESAVSPAPEMTVREMTVRETEVDMAEVDMTRPSEMSAAADQAAAHEDGARADAAREEAAHLERMMDARVGHGACAELRSAFDKRLPRSARRGGDREAATRSIREALTLYQKEAAWRRERSDYAAATTEAQSELRRRRAEEAYRASLQPDDDAEEGADGHEDTLSVRLKAIVDSEPWIKRRTAHARRPG